MKPTERINKIAQKESGKEYPLDRDWILAILKYLDEEYERLQSLQENIK